jgi:hypothetical protein
MLISRASDKCTSILTRAKGGSNDASWIVGHNEDWDADSQDRIVVLKKTIGTDMVY